MDKIDFRSDTVTWPTACMREAMATACLGDDVYGEDPTVNELETTAAQMLDKEARLFVASGTMGNLTAILTHAGRGDEAIVGEDAHAYLDEAGGMAVLGGVVPRPLPTDGIGRMSVNQIEDVIRPDDPHYPTSRLILLENTYGEKNGFPIPVDYFTAVRAVADRHQLAIHLDGARFFNAAVALDVPPHALAEHVDSISICLSKGLCAPVGSVLCGNADFIKKARRTRKVIGGGMRQAGVLAAAGLVSLRDMTGRLAEDHRRARLLASELNNIPGICVDGPEIKTNIIFFRLENSVSISAFEISRRLREDANIWVGAFNARQFRVVTHYWIDDFAIELLLENLENVLNQS